MKKLLCILLSVLMIAGVSAAAVSAGAEQTAVPTLTVTANGANPVTVPVGSELLYTTYLNAGPDAVISGQGEVHFDTSCVSFDPYEGDTYFEDYCFPTKISQASLTVNIEHPGEIHYNFSAAKAVQVFNNDTTIFARFRFKAIAPGTVDIDHTIKYLMNSKLAHVYQGGKASETINPYTINTIEPAAYLTGDADNDYTVTIMDASYIQNVAAGADLSVITAAADASGDGKVSLRDALQIRRYLAAPSDTSPLNQWIFASEQ